MGPPAGTENLLPEISIDDPVAQCCAVSADGKKLAIAKPGGQIELWDLSRRQRMRSSAAYRGSILDLQFSADGQWLAVADEQATTVWNLLTDQVQSSRSPLAVDRLPFLSTAPGWPRTDLVDED